MGGNETEFTYPSDFIKVKNESGSEEIHYSAFYESVPEEYKRLAEETLNETDENRRKGMKKLRAFAQKENLACTDNDLLLVLRASKYNLKKSEKKLKKYTQLRKQLIKLVANMDEEKIKLVLEDLPCGILPYRDKHGRAILFSRPNVQLELYDPDDVDIYVFALTFYLFTSIPLTSLTGICYIGECKCDSFYVLYPIFNQFRKSYINLFLEAPLRIGRIEFVNENSIIRLFYNVIRPILPEKIKKRVFFSGAGYKNLQKTYSPDILPKEFGGNLGPISDKFYRERLLNYMQKLKTECETIQQS